MNSVIKMKWLNALRSGQYNKGNTVLRNKNNSYSPLGVLCEVTGNASNRNMGKSYPKLNSNGMLDRFVGLTPSMQKRITTMAQRSDNFNDVINYISRNVKATR